MSLDGDVVRSLGDLLNLLHDGVEPLDMAHPHHKIGLLDQPQETLCLLDSHCDGLLDQAVYPCVYDLAGRIEVVSSGNAYAYRLCPCQQLLGA